MYLKLAKANSQPVYVGENSPNLEDRCYDLLNIFAEKRSEKIGVFVSKQSKIMQKYDS
jgi:hypothetical protein